MLCTCTCFGMGPGFLTPVSSQDPEAILRSYLNSSRMKNALSERDLAEMRLKDRTRDRGVGITHLYYHQTLRGIEVVNGILAGHINAQGQLINITNQFVPDLEVKTKRIASALEPDRALDVVADHLGIILTGWTQIQATTGANRFCQFEATALSLDSIPVQLKYLPDQKSNVHLVWSVVVRVPERADWLEVFVDASTPRVLGLHNWTVHDSWPVGRPHANHKKNESNPAAANVEGLDDGSTYYVVPYPFESPNHGSLDLVASPADPAGSPFGWHDTDGSAGPEFTITRGNNVHAFQDRDGNDFSAGDEPDGTSSLTFNLPPDFGEEPDQYTDSATINLFYWNNIVHDLLFLHGFDAGSGNFQQNNYGEPGVGNDYVRALAQAGADLSPPSLNNANFSTPPEGSTPRMRMYEWTGPSEVEIHAPGSIAGTYLAGSASFGTLLDSIGITEDFELVDDGSANPSEGCNPLVGFTAGKIALIDRGSCEFGVKVLNAEQAGAIGAIVINNQGDDVISMGPGASGNLVTIPSVFMGQSDGALIKGQLGSTVNGTLRSTFPRRDSDYDSGIIAHEYGHGVSNRLTGGPSSTGCLQNTEQAGEGWSDFFALVYTALPGAMGDDPRGVGTYSSFQTIEGPGIREFPYSTDMSINPVTYDKLKDSSIAVPHGVGHVFNTMLWELYWGLVDAHGFDPDLYHGTGGNNMCIRLVIEGMKQQACSPSFIDARDGILAADLALYGGANQCIIWTAFAKRGLGFSANAGSSFSITDGTEAFDMPPTSCCESAAISNHPNSGDFCVGDSTELSVLATGDGLTYQWQKDGVDLPGATQNTLQLNSLTTGDSGAYHCVVSGQCGDATSQDAQVNVSAELTYGVQMFESWMGPFAAPGCGDVNQNQLYDILDFINTL